MELNNYNNNDKNNYKIYVKKRHLKLKSNDRNLSRHNLKFKNNNNNNIKKKLVNNNVTFYVI